MGGSDSGVYEAGDAEGLGSDEETNVFSHESSVGAFDPVKPLAVSFVSDLFEDGSVDDEECTAGGSALNESVGGVVGSAGESEMAVVVLSPVEDGGSRDASVATHSVFGGFSLCEAETADDGPMVGVGDGKQLVEGAGLEAHVGINHEQPVAV
ncbi:MAG TPA: hypothetical protein VIG24_09805 [Acidimicrobiia bacterium]